MKGILCCGGSGTRLYPATLAVNKHFLVHEREPLFLRAVWQMSLFDIDGLAVVTSPEAEIGVIRLLSWVDATLPWIPQVFVQDRPLGIPHAIGHARDFVKNDSCIVMLADNIFSEPESVAEEVMKWKGVGCCIYTAWSPHPQDFGNVIYDGVGEIKDVVEKPQDPTVCGNGDNVLVGLYGFDHNLWSIIPTLELSARGESEIIDVIRHYLVNKELAVRRTPSLWRDVGTWDDYEDVIRNF